MKLHVEGIEEVELTDPQGLCNPPGVPQLPSPSLDPARLWPGNPIPTGIYPTPQIPTPPGFPAIPRDIRPGDVPHLRPRWGIGGPMIQQAGDPKDTDKWEKNYNSGGQEDGDGNSH